MLDLADQEASVANDAGAVATLILAMNRSDASRLLGKLDEDEIRTIVRRAAALGQVPPERLLAIVDAFEAELSKSPPLSGSELEAERLIHDTLSDDVAERILAELNDNPIASDTWSQLTKLEAREVAEAIANEQPQVTAFILSQIEPDFAAQVMAEFETSTRRDLFQRLLDAANTKERPSKLLEAHLSKVLFQETTTVKSGPIHIHAAGILNQLDKAEIKTVIDEISTERPQEAKILRGMIFAFEDITLLATEDRAKLFEAVPPEQMVLALTDAPPELCEAALGGLTARSRRMIESDLKSGQSRAEDDIVAARRWIAQLAINLAQEGKIEFPSEEQGPD